MKEVKVRKELVEQSLLKVGSRYLLCSLIAKRTNQLIRYPDSQGAGWAINRSLGELLEDRIRYEAQALEDALPPTATS